MDGKGKDPGAPVLTVSDWGELALIDKILDDFLKTTVYGVPFAKSCGNV